MSRFVALLRGINVGPTTAVGMPALVGVFADAGYGDARALLRSGNVVFSADAVSAAQVAALERRVAAGTGVPARVLVHHVGGTELFERPRGLHW